MRSRARDGTAGSGSSLSSGIRVPGEGARGPLLAIRSNYFLIYAIQGALLPYLSVYLAHEQGLSNGQIGFVLALTALGVVVAPPVVTALAEHRVHGRTLLEILLWLSGGSLLGFALSAGYWWILLTFAIFSLFHEPVKPLLDGIYFSLRRSSPGMARVSFHQVRIWGTAGYMVPGIALYFLVRWQDSLAFLPFLALGLVVTSALAARWLPRRDRAPASGSGGDGGSGDGTDGAPARTPVLATLRAAVTAMGDRKLAPFLLAMFLLQATISAYSAFYPLQVTDAVGISERWLGPMTSLGVFLELGYMAAFGWFVRAFGWRWLMVLGAGTSAARVAALAAFPTVASVVGTQVVHGMVIVVTTVGSRILLDRQVDDRVRHAAQGMYAMLVIGGGRIVGNAAGGVVAAGGLGLLFWSAAVASGLAAVILAWILRPSASPSHDHLSETGHRKRFE